jgi:hypothetical protein
MRWNWKGRVGSIPEISRGVNETLHTETPISRDETETFLKHVQTTDYIRARRDRDVWPFHKTRPRRSKTRLETISRLSRSRPRRHPWRYLSEWSQVSTDYIKSTLYGVHAIATLDHTPDITIKKPKLQVTDGGQPASVPFTLGYSPMFSVWYTFIHIQLYTAPWPHLCMNKEHMFQLSNFNRYIVYTFTSSSSFMSTCVLLLVMFYFV